MTIFYHDGAPDCRIAFWQTLNDATGILSPVRFFDMTTSPNPRDAYQCAMVYSTLNPDPVFPRAIFDPARVTAEWDAQTVRNKTYLAAMKALGGIGIAAARARRFDNVDDSVELSIPDATQAELLAAVNAMKSGATKLNAVKINGILIAKLP